MIGIGTMGVIGMKQNVEGVNTIYKGSVAHLKELKIIADMYAVNIVNTAQKLREGTLSWEEGRKNVDEATRTIAAKWRAYTAAPHGPKERQLIEQTQPLLDIAETSIARMKDILHQEDRLAITNFYIDELYPTVEPISQKLSELINVQLDDARDIYSSSAERYKVVGALMIARNASIASETDEEAMQTAESGKAISDGAVETVNRVYTSSVELAATVKKLNVRVGEIGEIVTVIKGIADQTNLLALNAAIEAARAGEQGRGFAVVADEVRRLAERTIAATTEISEKIGAVQAESDETTKSMGKASEEVTRANDHIKHVSGSLVHIVESVQKVRDQITLIATAIDEQSSASEEVSNNAAGTSVIAKEMEKASEEVMHEANRLVLLEEDLRSFASGFRTNGDCPGVQPGGAP